MSKQNKSVVGLKTLTDTMEQKASSGTKRLGRVAISTNRSRCKDARNRQGNKSQTATSSHSDVPECSITESFSIDFDADVIKAVDNMEAAACQPQSRSDNTAPYKSRTDAEERQSRHCDHSFSKSGKRRNLQSRKGGSQKLILIGDCGEKSKSESLTPTRSPAIKKRKGADHTLLSMSFQNTRLLCPASPSSASGPDSKRHVSKRKGSTLSSSKNNMLLRSEVRSGNKEQTDEDAVEIETDVSPNLTDNNQTVSKSGHRNVDSSTSIKHSSTPKTVAKAVFAASTSHRLNKSGQDQNDSTITASARYGSVGRSPFKITSPNGTPMRGRKNGHVKNLEKEPADHSNERNHRSNETNTCNDHMIDHSMRSVQKPDRTQRTKTKSTVHVPPASSGAKEQTVSSDMKPSCFTSVSKILPASAASPSSTKSLFVKTSDKACDKDKVDCGIRPVECEARISSHETVLHADGPQIFGTEDGTNINTHVVSEGAQQSFIEIASQNPESLSLSSWGLPGPVLEAYHNQGITSMFPWQAQCLTTGNVLNGGNLVYSAPTSAGKTMVSELLILKRVLETRCKALFILPFVSVTREKMVSLQHLYQDAGVRVGGFMGSHSPAGGFHSLDVAVCTIEKGNGLVNRLLEENRINELGVVVIDELHMVGDSNRGYLLELLLTKICYMAHKSKETSEHPVQVIGMSATLPNLDVLASWLDANLYHTDFRPVPLTEHIKVNTTIYDHTMTKVRDIEVKTMFQGDEDHIIPLCLETIMGGHAVLIFCPTKVWCEKMAEKIAREFYGIMKNPTALAAYTGETGFVKASEIARLPIDQVSLHSVLEQLGRSPVGVDPMLGKVLRYGVAFHHAGLTFDERDIVEGAFRQGAVKVLVATSTLSSGVNLPARRVIVRSPLFGSRAMDTLSYKQMAGRAGRKGVDTEGECVLVCKEGEKKIAQRLLKSKLPPVTSCLQCATDSTQLSRSMKRAILEVVVSGVASTPDDVARYVACTLLSASLPAGDESTTALITACLAFLEDNEFVTLHTVKHGNNETIQKYQSTQLGSAVLASSMSPDEGLAVFAELQRARQCFVLANELHIIYLVTPIYSQEITGNLDWYHFYCLWERLSPDMHLVAKTVGVEEEFLTRAISGHVPNKTAVQARAVAVHRRFYTALALHDLVQEVPLLEVAAKYNCNKGQLQSLMQSAATFAGMVTVFCARLGWTNMELLLAQFQQRLTLGVTRELCDLVRIPLLTGTMARMLFNAGYQTVTSIAHASPEDVETAFRKASPFQSNKKQEGESEWDMEQRRQARCVWLTGRKGVTELEAASAIISEAKAIIQEELGVRIDWQDRAADTSVMSASRTVLHSHSDVSVCSKGSPESSCRNSSLQGKTSQSADPEKENVIDSSTMPSRNIGKKSSCGSEGFETPIGTHRSKRSGALKSARKRTSSGRVVKSPPSGGRLPAKQTGRSPQDVSFFGQVVVSPPPSLRTISGQQSGVKDSDNNNVRAGSILHSTPRTAFQGRPGIRVLHKHEESIGTHRISQHQEIQGSDDAKKFKDRQRNGLPSSAYTSPSNDTGLETVKCAKDSCDDNSKHDHSRPKSDGGEQTLHRSASKGRSTCEKVNDSCDKPVILHDSYEADNTNVSDGEVRHVPVITEVTNEKQGCEKTPEMYMSRSSVSSSGRCSSVKTGPKLDSPPARNTRSTDSTFGKIAKEATPALEEPLSVSPLQEQNTAGYDDCFDDSLILNTQTDNLLSGGLNDSSFSSCKSPDKVTASTPHVPVSKRENMTDKHSPKELSVVNNKDKYVPSKQFVPKHKMQEDSLTPNIPEHDTEEIIISESDPQLHTECNKDNLDSLHDKGQRGYPLPANLHDNNFTENVFKSPLNSPTVNSNCKIGISSRKQSQSVIKDNISGNNVKSLLARDRDDATAAMYSDSDADASAELIAASNYERVAYVEDGVIEDSAVGSYQDLDIVLNDNLVCLDRDPEERDEEPELVRGLNFDMEYNVQEDLAIAANMSDSFSSSVNGSVHKSASAPGIENDAGAPCTLTSHQDVCNAGFSNSFTVSMMEKAFSDSFCDPVADKYSQGKVKPTSSTTKCSVLTSQPHIKSSGGSSSTEKYLICKEKDVIVMDKVKNTAEATNHSSESTTPQNTADCVPPTPPEESSGSFPAVIRHTPSRTCKKKSKPFQQTGLRSQSSLQKDGKKRRLRDKENEKGGSKSQNMKISQNSNDDNAESVRYPASKSQPFDNQNPSDQQKTVGNDLPTSTCTNNNPENDIPVSLGTPPPSQESLCVIDVCANADLFSTFVTEWRSQTEYSLSLACERKPSSVLPGFGIGSKFVQGTSCKTQIKPPKLHGIPIPEDEEKIIVGLAVSWAGHDAYYISFRPENTDTDISMNDTLAAPPCTQSVSLEQRTQTVKDTLQQTQGERAAHTVVAYDSKSTYNLLARSLGIVFGKCKDPQIACWLLDPGAREKTLHNMVTNFLPTDLPLLEDVGSGVGFGSLGLAVHNTGSSSGRMRAVVESIIARHLMDHFWRKLTQAGLDKAFISTEMPSMLTLARMELNGFGFSEEECESQKNLMMAKLSALEQEAYTLAGHPFSLTSTDDIAQILYLELQLPVNGDPSATKPVRTLGPNRRVARGRQKSVFSTSKDILQKLEPYHPLPAVILEWRRISSALTKHVYPLQKEKIFNEQLHMDRIFSESQMHTATGRVSMSEPNLQNIPKDFEILLPDVIGESPPTSHITTQNNGSSRKNRGGSRLQSMRGITPRTARISNPTTAKHMAVSMRHAFVPFPGGVILAADYSQLELRVIAHLSGDHKLITILNNDGDVFKLIAAQWKNTVPESVTAEERQHAKQICYGMLYGIGAKALGEQIGVDENDACAFMESFKAKYTGMRSYLRRTVEQCRENGYVTTVTGRRRYLPAIKDTNPHARAQAERQAVNTTVQGSAADIVKAAMNVIDQELCQTFPHTKHPHRHHSAEIGQPQGAFLTLQLHDELIYEVSKLDVNQVAHIIKHRMETTTPLSVRLPVKVKAGPSWGKLQDLDVDHM